jgi:NAD dependent epimerase/dehydratase family enzyme
MNILITGSSGLIGQALTKSLTKQGHNIYRMKRLLDESESFYWLPENNIIKYNEFADIQIVINLAGENIASGKWTKKRKDKILSSRIKSTQLLSQKLASLKTKPILFISGSAIGYYGDCGNSIIDEKSEKGFGFL